MCQQETSTHMFSLQVVPWVSLSKVWTRYKRFLAYLWKSYNFTKSINVTIKDNMFFTLQSSIEGSFKRSQVLLAKLHPVSHHQKSFPQSLNHICMSVLSKRMKYNLFIHAVTMAHEVKFLTSVTLYAPCASYIKHTKKLNVLSSSCYNIVYPLSLKCKKKETSRARSSFNNKRDSPLFIVGIVVFKPPGLRRSFVFFVTGG